MTLATKLYDVKNHKTHVKCESYGHCREKTESNDITSRSLANTRHQSKAQSICRNTTVSYINSSGSNMHTTYQACPPSLATY